MFRIFNEDCVKGSKSHFSNNEVDLLICDPPFGIHETTFDKHYNRKEDNVLDGYVEAPSDYYKWCYDWLSEGRRILKENGSAYIVSGHSKLREMLNAIDDTKFSIINHIIWKYNFGVYTKNKYVTSHYHILYLKKDIKSKPKFNTECRYNSGDRDKNNRSILYRDMEDVWTINKEYHPGKVKNKNKLPEELVKKMILYSSDKTDTVCDFFLGNFTTAIVANKLNRIPMGFEINSSSFEIGMKNLTEKENV